MLVKTNAYCHQKSVVISVLRMIARTIVTCYASYRIVLSKKEINFA
jgi:hypothetical protein